MKCSFHLLGTYGWGMINGSCGQVCINQVIAALFIYRFNTKNYIRGFLRNMKFNRVAEVRSPKHFLIYIYNFNKNDSMPKNDSVFDIMLIMKFVSKKISWNVSLEKSNRQFNQRSFLKWATSCPEWTIRCFLNLNIIFNKLYHVYFLIAIACSIIPTNVSL